MRRINRATIHHFNNRGKAFLLSISKQTKKMMMMMKANKYFWSFHFAYFFGFSFIRYSENEGRYKLPQDGGPPPS
jgi:hypothetical protein